MKSMKSMKKIKNFDNQNRFIISVKVGTKGQIVIPKEARKMFNIKSGDTLMVLGDKRKGIAIVKDNIFYEIGAKVLK